MKRFFPDVGTNVVFKLPCCGMPFQAEYTNVESDILGAELLFSWHFFSLSFDGRDAEDEVRENSGFAT